MQRTWTHFVIGVGEFLLLLLLFVVLINVRWTSMDDCFKPAPDRDTCYCEAFSDGLVKQPANTWSALTMSIPGLLVLASLGFARPDGSNPMTRHALLPATFGYSAVFLGPGSMFFHSTFSDLGGFLDSTSMYLFLSFVLVYQLLRLTRMPLWLAALVWVALNALLFTLARVTGAPTLVFALLGVATGIVQIVVFTRETLRYSAWFWAAIGTFAVAFTIWLLSRTGMPLCAPQSALQGHALWHVLSALTVGGFYLYLRRAPDLP